MDFGLRNLICCSGWKTIYTAVEVFTGSRLEQALVKDKGNPTWYFPAAQNRTKESVRTDGTAG